MQIRSVGFLVLAGLALGLTSASGATETPPIVFSADRRPALTDEIYRLDANGRRVDLSRSPFSDTMPVVSPDGRKVVFLSNRSRPGIYQVNVDGSESTRLATPPVPALPDDGAIQLAWAPNSRSLALATITGSTAKLSVIGRGRSPLVIANRYLDRPAWSPDGRLLTVYALGAHPSVRAFTPSGAPAWRIPVEDASATWSAKGLFLLAGHKAAHVYDERGRALLSFAGHDAAWSPEGSRMASLSGKRLEVRTTSGRVLFRKTFRRRFDNPGALVWADARRVVVLIGDRTLKVDTVTGKTARAPYAYFGGQRSPDGRFVIDARRRGSGFALGVSALDTKSFRVYGRVPGCFDDGSFDVAVEHAQFIPHRRSLVYQSYCPEPFAALYAVAPDGTGLRRLTHAREQETGPAWSPDGRRIAYTRADHTGMSCKGCPGSLVVADADGSHPRRLTGPIDPSYVDYGPSWSPDGSQILFTRGSFTAPAEELFVVPSAGGAPRDLHIAGSDGAWGPARIAYFDLEHSPATVWTARPDGTDRQRVAPLAPDFAPEPPAWSRSGTLAFLDGYTTVELVMGGRIQKVHLPFQVTSLAWSPDGTRFVVTADTATSASSDVYTVRTDGTDPKRLTRDIDAEGVSWR